MKFLVLVHPGDPQGYEKGAMPDPKLLEEMGKYNEGLVDAGILIGGEGLQPTSKGAMLNFPEKGKHVLIDGPFTETTEIIGGFWIWQVRSKEEALEWAKRAPMEKGATLEIRQAFEPEDFGPEVAKQERDLLDKIESQQNS